MDFADPADIFAPQAFKSRTSHFLNLRSASASNIRAAAISTSVRPFRIPAETARKTLIAFEMVRTITAVAGG
jgi:hypothetical protein